MYNKDQFIDIQQKFGANKSGTVFTAIISLIDKLEQKDIQDEHLSAMMDGLFKNYVDITAGDKNARKQAARAYSGIVKYVKDQYSLEQKGSIMGTYLAIFIGVGVAIGAALSGVNAGLMGAGIAIGAGLGVAIGTSMENKAAKEDRIY